MKTNLSEGHLSVLDAIRGACALWVLMGHTAAACGAGEIAIIRSHAVAVDIFMFISGFLMTYHYRLREDQEPWNSASTWFKFYSRRFFRLAPVYYLLLVVTLIFRNDLYTAFVKMSTTFPLPWTHLLALSANPPPWSWASVISHFTFLFGFIPQYCSDGRLPDWSIGLEMQFYLFFPFLMLLLKRFGYLSLVIVSLALWVVSHKLLGVYITSPAKLLGLFPQPSFLPLKLDCFLLGILTAEAYWFRFLKTNQSMVMLMLVVVTAFLVNASLYLEGAIIICIYFAFSKGNGWSNQQTVQTFEENFLSSRLVKFMADTSYSVYLVHFPILLVVISLLAAQSWYVSLSPVVRFGTLFTILASLVYPLAFALFKLVEQPGIRLGQQLVKKRKLKNISV